MRLRCLLQGHRWWLLAIYGPTRRCLRCGRVDRFDGPPWRWERVKTDSRKAKR